MSIFKLSCRNADDSGMAKALSMDLRERIIRAFNRGEGCRAEIARRFGVCDRTVARLIRLHHETGSVSPRPHGGGNPALFSGEKLQRLRALVAEHPDATLEELRDMSGVSCSVVTVHNTLKRLKLPRKKSRSTLPSKTALTSSNGVATGANRRPRSRRAVSSSSTRRARKPT
jgi:transposase